jgi:calcineurin-like phosphoesterase family protein
MTEYWFTSDTHFGHSNIIEYAKRPFRSVHEMDEEMIRRWNEHVSPGDIVFHLGDFAFVRRPQDLRDIVDRLNGQIRLIKGNHDSSRMIKNGGFSSIDHMLEWRVPPEKVRLITMCHYPMLMWRDSHQMEWHAHGHSHGLLPVSPELLAIDVGVDCWDFYPLHVGQLVKTFKKREKSWRAMVMKHDRPHGATRDGWNLYGLVAPHPDVQYRWLLDHGENWETQKGILIPKHDKDKRRCVVWAEGFSDITNRLPKGGTKGIKPPEKTP